MKRFPLYAAMIALVAVACAASDDSETGGQETDSRSVLERALGPSPARMADDDGCPGAAGCPKKAVGDVDEQGIRIGVTGWPTCAVDPPNGKCPCWPGALGAGEALCENSLWQVCCGAGLATE